MTPQNKTIHGIGQAPVEVLNSAAAGPFLLVCEHASCRIPPQFGDLGLSDAARESHIAWDPGALAVARHLSELLASPLVAGTVSRLIYDCNRPPSAAGAMPVKSEDIEIPGNQNLTDQQRQHRIDQIYLPFTAKLTEAIAIAAQPPILVTIHSFTKTFLGADRAVEVGILHDTDKRLADAMLELAPEHSDLRMQRNEPYGPQDGVTYTLQRHGLSNGLMNVMLEVRNDLIADGTAQKEIATMLAGLIKAALVQTGAPARMVGEGQ